MRVPFYVMVKTDFSEDRMIRSARKVVERYIKLDAFLFPDEQTIKKQTEYAEKEILHRCYCLNNVAWKESFPQIQQIICEEQQKENHLPIFDRYDLNDLSFEYFTSNWDFNEYVHPLVSQHPMHMQYDPDCPYCHRKGVFMQKPCWIFDGYSWDTIFKFQGVKKVPLPGTTEFMPEVVESTFHITAEDFLSMVNPHFAYGLFAPDGFFQSIEHFSYSGLVHQEMDEIFMQTIRKYQKGYSIIVIRGYC